MRGQLAFTGLILCTLLVTSTASAAERIAWETNLDTAWDAAVAEQKPLLIFITRDNCKFCTKMKKSTLIDQRVVGYVGTQFVPLIVNSKAEQRLVRDLKITSFPTTVVIATDKDIDDRAACELAKRFYGALAQGKAIQDAYEEAVGAGWIFEI